LTVLPLEDLCAEFGIAPAELLARGLVACEEATVLETVETGADGRSHQLTPAAAASWRQLRAEAATDGETLTIVSAFRSIERQIQIIRRKLAAGQTIDEILCVSAFPGYSEHHTGRAVDVSTPGSKPLELAFGDSSAFRWLESNAERFGFVMSYPEGNALGYQYEPWHWCYQS
jgi:D-alanyl-D-alanine carboxypeptidase